MESFSSCARC
uniref:MATE1 n=1 Tax=Arundo donax TaxID=35708 RepID=A0A0A9FQ41_ARUDO